MTTAVQTRPRYEDVPLPYDVPEHFFMLNGTLFHCIQPACDLKHHVYCSCER